MNTRVVFLNLFVILLITMTYAEDEHMDAVCRKSNVDCIDPRTDKECNGRGKCVCGVCICEPSGDEQYTGQYCKDCPTCKSQCETYKECVQCRIHQSGPLDEDQCNECSINPIGTSEFEVRDDEHLCVFIDDDDCKFQFKYKYDEKEDLIYVIAQNTKDCPTIMPESFDKLAQYSSLDTCFSKIYEDLAYCYNKALENSKSYLEGVDENSDWAKRVRCSEMWKLRDCWVASAKNKCTSMQTEQVHNIPYTFMPDLENICKDYPPNSSKYSFPIWLIVVIVLIGVTLLALGVFCGIRFYRKRREDQIRRQLSLPENEKLKSPPV